MIVGVIGSGAIGPDLAYGFLTALARDHGSRVYLVDIDDKALEAGAARIRGYVDKGVARGKIDPKVGKCVRDALVTTKELSKLADCDYVLEAASEDLTVKRKILAQLEGIVRPDCLIGFATSGLPRKHIAAEAKHPQRCFVNHPFFPAWRSLPIEIVESGDAALGRRMIATIEKLGRVPIVTADVECFAADDVFCNYISEAARIVSEKLATPAQVDAIVNDAIGGGGPFNVMDLTKGNLLVDKCQKLMEKAPTGGSWFAPPAILTEQGNRPWHDPKAPADASYEKALAKQVLDRILAVLVSRTYFVTEQNVCPPTETNWLLRMALGFRKGMLEIAEDLGIERVSALCSEYAAQYGKPGFYVPMAVGGEGLRTGPAGTEKKLPKFSRNVQVERDGVIGVIRIFRPEVKNALSKDTLAEIDAGFAQLLADDAVKGVLITSYGGTLAGADINELAALKTSDECRRTCLDSHPIFARISQSKKPVVAAIDGPVLGGGAELAMACHARVVGTELVLGQPEVNLGIIPGYGGTQRLPRLIGVARALELLRTGRAIGAAEACNWGWAHGIPTRDYLHAAKALLAEVIAGKTKIAPVDPAPVAGAVEVTQVDIGHRSAVIDAIVVDVVRRGLAKPLAEGLTIEADGFARCKDTVDMDIGMKNFIQNGPRVPAMFLNE